MSVTYEDKKAQIKQSTIMISVIIGLLCAYLLGYAGKIMQDDNKGFVEALLAVSDEIKALKIFYMPTSTTLAYSFIGLFLGLIAYLVINNDNIRNDSYIMKEIAGTGGFMTKKDMTDYSNKYIYKDPPAITNYPVAVIDWKELYKKYSQNMIMSRTFSRPINSRTIIGNNNVLIVGGAGTGKSRFMIKPNMLQMNASYVITDPSGEMIYSLGKVLRDNGYKIKIFNISDMQHSNCYNPIKYIRNEAGVNMLIQCLIDNTTKGEGGGDNQFFVDAEKLLYSACLFYLINYCNNESMKNFAGVMDMINSSNVDEKNPNAKSPLDELFDKLPKSSLAKKYYTAFKQAAGKTLKSIIISCVTRLQPFMTPQVANLTRTDELELEKLGDERTALFIITPQADRTYSFLASMLYSQLFETLYHKGEQQKANGESEELHIPVRCLMDEFANIGTVPEFPSKLSTMRKYNISATIVLQDTAQIESMYEKDWRTLVANCSTKVFLGSPELDTQKWFSEQLGEMTVRSKSNSFSEGGKGSSNKSFQYTSRKVMTPEELSRLPKEKCIVYTQNMRPVLDLKYKYEDHPYYEQTADAHKENGFEYNKLSIYDNSKIGNYMNIFVAMHEAARISKKEEKSDNNKKDGYDPNEIELSDKMVERIYKRFTIECQTKAYDYCDDEVCIIEVSPIPTKYLKTLAENTQKAFQLKRVLVCTPVSLKNIDGEGLFGMGIDNGDEDDPKLIDVLKMEEHEGTCKKTGMKDENVMVVFTRENMDKLRNNLNMYYRKDGEDSDGDGEE